MLRAVIVPATPLLVPGASGRDDVLADVRAAVHDALAELVAGSRRPLVVAHGRALRSGLLRPSLAAVGLVDGRLRLPGTPRTEKTFSTGGMPDVEPLPASPDDIAGVPASVALLALAAVLGDAVGDVRTLELPPEWTAAADRTAQRPVVPVLRAADGLVVAGGGMPGSLDPGPGALAPGVAHALAAVGAGWTGEVRVLPQAHDHLPPEYRLTLLRS